MLRESRERCFSRATALVPASRSSCRYARRNGREISVATAATRSCRAIFPADRARKSRGPHDSLARASLPPSSRQPGARHPRRATTCTYCRPPATTPLCRGCLRAKPTSRTADGALRAHEPSPSRRRAGQPRRKTRPRKGCLRVACPSAGVHSGVKVV